jgi:NAD(P)-dependent dehydrogenase (short-subunit alcohol dehydrogenase family)
MEPAPSRHRRPRRVTVIVGASSGIGRAAAHRFARRGDDLVLAARSPETLEEVAEECRLASPRSGGTIIPVPTDVRDEAQVRALADRAMARFGRIDVWVGAASVFSYGSVEQTPTEIFDGVLDTNFSGQVRSARAVLPIFRRQRSGVLILVGSLYSRVASAYTAPYVSSKWALRGFAAALRQELRDLPGVRVSVVMPATVDTPIYQHAANYSGRAQHPLPPVIAPERVARSIVRNARRPRPEVAVGLAQWTVAPLAAVAPRTYERLTRFVMAHISLRSRPTPDTPGTVLAPKAETNAVTGGWRSTPLRVLTALTTVGAVWVVVLRAGARR